MMLPLDEILGKELDDWQPPGGARPFQAGKHSGGRRRKIDLRKKKKLRKIREKSSRRNRRI